MRATLTIREVASRAGVASSTLRYYERRGLIAPAGRDAHGRIYHRGVLVRLWLVDYFQQAGYTLAEIADLLANGSAWPDSARRKHEELEAGIAVLREAQRLLDDALACGCDDLEACTHVHAGLPPA